MTNTADVTGGKPFAVYLRCQSAVNTLVAFYDIQGRVYMWCPGHNKRIAPLPLQINFLYNLKLFYSYPKVGSVQHVYHDVIKI
jgi:hypothetical protein